MAANPIDVLLVEDNPADARLLVESLKGSSAQTFTVTRVSRLSEAVKALSQARADAVLLDLSLPDSSGLETVDRVRAVAPAIPIVVLTGLQDEAVALAAVRRGVQDYLIKGECENGLAARALRYAIERKRADAAINDSLARLSAIVDTAPDAIITIDEHGVIESANPATGQMFGYSRAELIGQNISMLIPEPYRSEHDGYLEHYLQTGEPQILRAGREVVGLRKDGSTFPHTLSIGEFRLGGRRMFTAMSHDMSERRRLEREVLEATGAEQQRIGQELHDGLCQQLLGIAFSADMLAHRLRESEPPGSQSASQIAQMIRDSIGQARNLAHGLNPVNLEAGGLTASLADLARRAAEQFQLECTFQCDEPPPVTDAMTSLHLYRISQEAISNAIRHGKAKRVEIRLSAQDKFILSIRDDGRGLPREPQGAGMGLKSMAYRARMMGGILTVRPGKSRGTVVTCSFDAPAGRGPHSEPRARKTKNRPNRQD